MSFVAAGTRARSSARRCRRAELQNYLVIGVPAAVALAVIAIVANEIRLRRKDRDLAADERERPPPDAPNSGD